MIKSIKVNAHLLRKMIILIICTAVIVIIPYLKKSSTENITCRADINIFNQTGSFRGVLDYKSGDEKGIANITGNLSTRSGIHYNIQRTILFSVNHFGISPVWTSEQVIVADNDDGEESVMLSILPAFYVKSAKVTDVDFIPLGEHAWLVTKSSFPYIYCKKYNLK